MKSFKLIVFALFLAMVASLTVSAMNRERMIQQLPIAKVIELIYVHTQEETVAQLREYNDEELRAFLNLKMVEADKARDARQDGYDSFSDEEVAEELRPEFMGSLRSGLATHKTPGIAKKILGSKKLWMASLFAAAVYVAYKANPLLQCDPTSDFNHAWNSTDTDGYTYFNSFRANSDGTFDKCRTCLDCVWDYAQKCIPAPNITNTTAEYRNCLVEAGNWAKAFTIPADKIGHAVNASKPYLAAAANASKGYLGSVLDGTMSWLRTRAGY